jgi:hypothetical protein
MEAVRTSLRVVAETWFVPNRAIPVRVRSFRKAGSRNGRYVQVEASAPTGRVKIYFFRHDDGAWRVFPPAATSGDESCVIR